MRGILGWNPLGRSCLANHIANQGLKLLLQAKKDMEKVRARSLTETAAIKAEVKSTIALFKKRD